MRGSGDEPCVVGIPDQDRRLVGVEEPGRNLYQRLQHIVQLQRPVQDGVCSIERLELPQPPSRWRMHSPIAHRGPVYTAHPRSTPRRGENPHTPTGRWFGQPPPVDGVQ